MSENEITQQKSLYFRVIVCQELEEYGANLSWQFYLFYWTDFKLEFKFYSS